MVESEYAGQEWLMRNIEKGRINEKFFYEDTRMSLVGYGIPPKKPEHPALLGGVQINVGSGRTTAFERFSLENNSVFGKVIVVDDGSPASGKAYVTLFPDKPIDAVTITVNLDTKGGFFIREIKNRFNELKARRISGTLWGTPGHGAMRCKRGNNPINIFEKEFGF